MNPLISSIERVTQNSSFLHPIYIFSIGITSHLNPYELLVIGNRENSRSADHYSSLCKTFVGDSQFKFRMCRLPIGQIFVCLLSKSKKHITIFWTQLNTIPHRRYLPFLLGACSIATKIQSNDSKFLFRLIFKYVNSYRRLCSS
jgi:hypothetical protein